MGAAKFVTDFSGQTFSEWATRLPYTPPPFHINMQTFKVLYFASAKDATGLSTETIPFPDPSKSIITIKDFFALLKQKHPKLAQKKILSSVAIAINLEYVDLDTATISPNDEVAIIPPVSGG